MIFGRPFIEILPEYPAAGAPDRLPRTAVESVQLAGAPEVLSELVDQVILAGLPAPRALYAHQEDALVASFGRSENIAITSGTGSGKTEAFLLPILAHLTKEALGWAAPARRGGQTLVEVHDARSPQRTPDGHRPAAVRALVMFPMNALVEDQLVAASSISGW